MIVATLHDDALVFFIFLIFSFARPLPLSLPAERVSTQSAPATLAAYPDSAPNTVASK